jgi:hypothetical protein
MNKWLKILIGLVLIIGMILLSFYSLSWGRWDFGRPAWEFLKGGIIWALILLGLLFLMLGISELRE